jgi:hypothetical protein
VSSCVWGRCGLGWCVAVACAQRGLYAGLAGDCSTGWGWGLRYGLFGGTVRITVTTNVGGSRCPTHLQTQSAIRSKLRD